MNNLILRLLYSLLGVIIIVSCSADRPGVGTESFMLTDDSAIASGSFLSGRFNILPGEESIITHGLPQEFKARFAITASDQISIDPGTIVLSGATGVPPMNVRFQSGAVSVVDATSVVLRVPSSPNSTFQGAWSIVGEGLAGIPFQEYGSLIGNGNRASNHR